MNRPYQYKIPRASKAPKTITGIGKFDKPIEVLTGYVNGQKASDLEERFAIALSMEHVPFEFQPSYFSGTDMPGEIRPDFVIYIGGVIQPVQIDGDFTHKNSAQREDDRTKDQLLDDYLRAYGALPTRRLLEGEVDLSSVESCRKIVRSL